MVAIDQYAEAATANREYFLNKPHSIGGPEKRRRALEEPVITFSVTWEKERGDAQGNWTAR
jgi:hypothetical protein